MENNSGIMARRNLENERMTRYEKLCWKEQICLILEITKEFYGK